MTSIKANSESFSGGYAERGGNCLLRMKGIYSSLKSAERRLVDYIFANTALAVNCTIEELAQKSGTSYATIARFCKKLEFHGYKDFKNSLIYDITHTETSIEAAENLSIPPNASATVICDETYNFTRKVIDETRSIIDSSVIETAVKAITASRNLFIIGSGVSGISAKYAYTKLFRIGIPCTYEPDFTLCKMHVAILGENDVLLAISSSGRTSFIVECARNAKANGATVISLSDFAISPLTKSSDINLYTTPRSAGVLQNIDTPLISGQMMIIDMLYSFCCVKRSDSAVESYRSTKKSADNEKIDV